MSNSTQIPFYILDDLSSRFIINVPEEERNDLIRLCFQIELAHWFYLDFYCSNPGFKKCTIKAFIKQILNHVPFLQKNVKKFDEIYEKWKNYKQAVPTYGAIILNPEMTHVLLVQGFWASNSWGFPKGKVNEDEEPHLCAVREVLEETGFDISKYIDKNQYIEHTVNDTLIRLYIVAGVPRTTHFAPTTRNEIRLVSWMDIQCIPTSKKEITQINPNMYFMVIPFMKPLRKWIASNQQRSNARRNRGKSTSTLEENNKMRALDLANLRPKNKSVPNAGNNKTDRFTVNSPLDKTKYKNKKQIVIDRNSSPFHKVQIKYNHKFSSPTWEETFRFDKSQILNFNF